MRKTPAASPLPAVMSIHPSMSRTFILLTALGAALLLPACKEKSEAEKADEERAALRDEKRKKAVELYQTLAKEYPEDPNAAEAKKKAAALEAMAPKK
jgi:mannose/fructose-specific phosphotransferase system component IIA